MNRIVIGTVLGLIVSNTAGAGPFDNVAGNWRGQTEYRATVNAVEDATAHAVVDLYLRVDAGGKVTGHSAENGCQLLGIAKPFSSSYSLEATVSKCRAKNLNGRYRGVIGVSKGALTLSLQMSQPGSVGKSSKGGHITSTMTR